MWIYDYYLKNGKRKIFYTDEPYIPKELEDFLEKCEEEEIEDKFCDHFPITVAEFGIDLNDADENEEIIICK